MAGVISALRRQQLAAGLLRCFAAMLSGKGIALVAIVWGQSTGLTTSLVLSHLLIMGLALAVAHLCTRRPRSAAGTSIVLLTCFLLLAIPHHSAFYFQPPWMAIVALYQVLLAMLLLLAMALQWSSLEIAPARWWPSGIRKPLQSIISLVVVLMVTEVGMRQIGMEPGRIASRSQLAEVDEWVEYHDAAANDAGIYAYTPATAQALHTALQAGTPLMGEWRRNIDGELAHLLEDQMQFANGNVHNEYARFIDRILHVPDTLRDPVDVAYTLQVQQPINADGFRSIPFRNDTTRKRKVLLLGDSFTWGHSATHFSQSFGELLAAGGYAVYNSGISGADPTQYAAVARKYIPIIQPDVVVVNLYLGNDIFDFERPLAPGHALQYRTNAGTFIAYPGRERLPNAQAAYAFLAEMERIPATDSLAFNRWCSRSVLGTLLWQGLSAAHVLPFVRPNRGYWARCAAQPADPLATRKPLLEIQQIATAHGSQFVLAIIPSFAQEAPKFQDLQAVFAGLSPHFPADLTVQDYTAPNGHFNDKGHAKYAAMLRQILQALVP